MASRLDALDRIGLTRLGVLAAGDVVAPPAEVAAVLAELAHVGVRVTNPDAAGAALVDRAAGVVAEVRLLRGELADYSPLFAGFPDHLPTFDDAETRFTIGIVRLVYTHITAGKVTDDDVRAAMDFRAIGWWPASSVPQDVDKARVDRELQRLLPPDDRVEWLDVTLVDQAGLHSRLREWTTDALTAPAPLRSDVRDDVATLVRSLGTDVAAADVPFVETRTLLTRLLWERDPRDVAAAGPSPDDLLRLFADLTGGDVSLAAPVTFPRLTRAQRRAVVAALESSPRLPDVFRRRGLWLAIARGLHLGEAGLPPAPRVAETFARLRAGRHDATSLPSRVERAVRAGRLPEALAALAAESPGVLARGLRRFAALAEASPAAADDVPALLDAVRRTAPGVPTRVLYAARAQVADNGRTYPRVAFTKAGAPLKIDRPAGHLRVSSHLRSGLLQRLEAAIDTRSATKPSWAGRSVFVDPLLRGVLMPDALRTTAQGLVQLERGSRVPLGEAPVLRLFVHWRQGEGTVSDLDLSLQALDADFRLVSQVSWTQLADGLMTHSGDLTSAPDGAQEFVDVRLDEARRGPGWRYLVPSVFRYAGPSFAGLPEAHVGWMLRDECSADRRTFDPATVVNAFPLTGRAGTAVPMLVDLATDEVVSTDLYLRSGLGSSVERGGLQVREVVAAAARRADIKVSVAEVAERAAAARGARLSDTRADADLTFGLDDSHTFNALRPERLLAELY